MGTLKRNQPTYSMAVKCYEEQLLDGEEGLSRAIKAMPADRYMVMAIKHDKSLDKVHWHIILRHTERKDRGVVSTLLKMLSIEFRSGTDDKLWNERGVESVGLFNNYAMYLLHQTEDAIRDGKEPYDKDDFITNMSDEEIDATLAGYRARKKKAIDIYAYNDLARDAGYNLKSYDDFIDGMGIPNMSAATENNIRKCYLLGASKRARENERISRFIVYIKPDKISNADAYIYAAEKACSDNKTAVSVIGENIVLEPDTKSLIALQRTNDDDKYGILKVLSEDYICEIGNTRNKQVWAGDVLVFISLVKPCRPEKFFQCEVINDKLVCNSAPSKISEEEAKLFTQKYKLFKTKFDDAFDEYMKTHRGVSIDLADLNS